MGVRLSNEAASQTERFFLAFAGVNRCQIQRLASSRARFREKGRERAMGAAQSILPYL